MDENALDWVQSLYHTSERQETGIIDQEAFFVHVFHLEKIWWEGSCADLSSS